MNTTIWKYVLPVNSITASFTTTHSIPIGAKFLNLREQHGDIAMWFEVDPQAAQERRGFQLFGTGIQAQGLSEGLEYRGTAIFVEGQLVLHVYEVKA